MLIYSKRKLLFGVCTLSLFFLLTWLPGKIVKRTLEVFLVKSYWSNGNIKEEYFLIDNKYIHGQKKEYYKNGSTKLTQSYVMNVKNGEGTEYFENGNVACKMKYYNGNKNGNWIHFYPNGKVNKQIYWINGKIFGNAYFYHANGMLRSFVAYDFNEKPQYLVKYDTSGKVLREEGAVLNQLLIDQKLDSIPIGVKTNMVASVSIPPKRNVFVVYGMYVNSKFTLIDKCKLQYNTASFSHSFNKYGKDSLFVIGKMFDNSNNLVKSDTIVALINVVR